MPEVSREQLTSMLDEVDPSEHEQFLSHLKQKGYTLQGQEQKLSPQAVPKQNQPIYQPEDQMSKPQMALEATKEAFNTKIPGLEQTGKFLQETAPDYIAEKSGQFGEKTVGALGSAIKGAGLGVAGIGSMAAQAIPRTVGDASIYGLGYLGKGANALKSIPGMSALDKSVPGSEALISGAKKVGSHVGEFMGTLMSNILSIGGAEVKSPWIRAVINDPGTVKHFGEEFGMDMQQAAVKAIESEKDKVGSQYRAIQDSLTQFGIKGRLSPKVDTARVLNTVAKDFESKGIHVPTDLGGNGASLKKYRFDRGSSEDAVIKRFMGALKKPLDFGESLNLRRQLDDAIRYSKHGEMTFTSEAQAALRTMRRALNTEMTRSVPANMRTKWVLSNQNYEKLMRTLGDFHSQVLGKTPFQTASKISRAVRTGRSSELIDIPSQHMYENAMRSMMDLRRSVVASHFKEILSKGFSASSLLPGSPRAVGYLSALIGGGKDLAAAVATSANEKRLISLAPLIAMMHRSDNK